MILLVAVEYVTQFTINEGRRIDRLNVFFSQKTHIYYRSWKYNQRSHRYFKMKMLFLDDLIAVFSKYYVVQLRIFILIQMLRTK